MCPVAGQAIAAITSLRLTLADLVRAHGDAYRRTHRLATVQTRALGAIAACRTALLGGHRETCDHCGATRLPFNSCRNRHCPTCHSSASARWIEARRADLLPIPYFHVVFTLPHALHALAQGNPRVIDTLLFRAAADTLLTFGRDPRTGRPLVEVRRVARRSERRHALAARAPPRRCPFRSTRTPASSFGHCAGDGGHCHASGCSMRANRSMAVTTRGPGTTNSSPCNR